MSSHRFPGASLILRVPPTFSPLSMFLLSRSDRQPPIMTTHAVAGSPFPTVGLGAFAIPSRAGEARPGVSAQPPTSEPGLATAGGQSWAWLALQGAGLTGIQSLSMGVSLPLQTEPGGAVALPLCGLSCFVSFCRVNRRSSLSSVPAPSGRHRQ